MVILLYFKKCNSKMLIKINSETPKFKCNACGACCSHIRGIVPKEDIDFLKGYAFGKLPVVQLVSFENMTFPLWDWEAKRFQEWQHEVNVDASIKPLRAIMDMNTNKAIILSYFMDSATDACPFLKNNKCSIYHTKRAYVCRLFPFNRSPLSYGKISKEAIFGECGAMQNILPKLPKDYNEMIKFLNEAFPDGSFLNAVQNELVVEWSNKAIVDLIRKRIIKPAFNQPYNFLLNRIINAKKIDFTDFLVDSNYLTKSEMENMIERFDNNQDAIDKVKHYM